MKRFLSILLVAVLALGLMATSAFAAGITVEAKDVEVTLKATDVTFQSCLATINFDHSKLTLKEVKAGEILPSGTKDVSQVKEASEVSGVSSMFAWNADNGGKAMIAYASAADVSANGIMFTLTFEVAEGVTEAEVKADVSFYDENNKEDGKVVAIEATTSDPAIIKVSASGVLYGDVNGDSKVNPADRAALARYLAKWPEYQSINMANADVNGDGNVTPADRAHLARYFAGWAGYVLGQPAPKS